MTEVVTGEAVVLDLTVARFPSRLLALLLDVVVQLTALFFLEAVVALVSAPRLDEASTAALFAFFFVAIIIGYPVAFETLSRGKSLGKLALGLRVVSDDGGPIRFRQALIRGLSAAFVEFWLLPFNIVGMPAGLITSMVSARGKRLGDLFAGTFVISERVPARPEMAPAFTVVPPPLAGWAQHLDLARLTDQAAATASSYLRRWGALLPEARARLGPLIAAEVAGQVSPPPPPGTPPEALLAAVLAVRRDREWARLQTRLAAQAAHAARAAVAAQSAQPGASAPTTAYTSLATFAPPAPTREGQTVSLTKPQPRDGDPDDNGFAAPL